MSRRREGAPEVQVRRPRRSAPLYGGALAEVREHLGTLFEDASDIILVNDREGRIVAANRAARDFGGYTLDDVTHGVYLREVLTPADCEAAMILTQRALDGLPVPEVYEREAVLRDGRRRILELRSNVLRRRGRPYALQTIGRDVTENKEAAAFQASLLQVSEALLTAPSLDQLGKVVCEQASRVLGVDAAYLWLRRGNDLVACAAYGRGAQELIGLRRSMDSSVIGEIYRADDLLVVNDFAHSLYALDETRGFGVQAMLAIPLRRNGPPVGILVFTDSTNPRCFTGVLRQRGLIYGAQTTVAIESALAREREEEEGRVSAALLRVTRAIRESLEEAEVVPQIARSTREAVECDWAAVALWDTTKGALQVTTIEGWTRQAAEELMLLELRPQRSDSGVQVTNRLMTHETVEIPEPPDTAEPLFRRWGIASLLAVPMLRGGRVIGVLGIGYHHRRGRFSARERRITEGIAAQAAVAVDNARLVEDLRRANRLKSEFLGTMSHELRTPLSAILGYADLMRDGAMGPISEEQAEVLDRMLLNGRGLLELINMTLDVNRLDAGHVTLDTSEFTLDQLFTELRSEFAVRARQDGVTLSWPETLDLPPLRTDHGKLKLVLRNLVDNALKFTAAGTVAVTAACDLDADRVRVSVRDTGMGIAEGSLASIFDMFYQIDRAPARGGVGLGLYLVRRYTELMGGRVTVKSTAGQGSTFSIEIPRRVRGSDPV
ncbi:MAG TPA: GAF domain-containing protein [Candidatus Acidoferrales bacterium]|nr:GAF domain-containing protein [Candidatus Acidoferrales bacterium]